LRQQNRSDEHAIVSSGHVSKGERSVSCGSGIQRGNIDSSVVESQADVEGRGIRRRDPSGNREERLKFDIGFDIGFADFNRDQPAEPSLRRYRG
jgi:hypothetical protein